MSKTKITTLGSIFAAVILTILGFCGLIGKNDDQNWQYLQYPNGSTRIIDKPGFYLKAFGSIWTYPKAVQEAFNKEESESVRTTFNDGGTAEISTIVRYRTPTKEEDRRRFHKDFSGNIENANISVRAHLVNCIKSTGPLMSSTENQTSRKSEFNGVVQDQLRSGLYKMRQVEKVLKDKFDESGKPITVYATEIINDKNGRPIIIEESPLKQYGLEVLQFSTTETEYDAQTRKQFAAKKQSFLQAEQSKASRKEEVEKRLMVVERGLREKAEVEAKANVEKANAVIAAERDKQVAELAADKEKKVAETKAAKLLAVAKLEKQTAETAAAQKLAVAKLERAAADEKAAQIVTLAKAEDEKIRLAGAITEKERVLAEIAARRDVQVAENLAKIKTPSTMIIGGGENSQGGNLTENLMNLKLLEATGMLDKKPSTSSN